MNFFAILLLAFIGQFLLLFLVECNEEDEINRKCQFKIGVVFTSDFVSDNEMISLTYALDKVNKNEFYVQNRCSFQAKLIKLPKVDSFKAFNYGIKFFWLGLLLVSFYRNI